jgi:hypothetical protein
MKTTVGAVAVFALLEFARKFSGGLVERIRKR